jgi:hypothetical protein
VKISRQSQIKLAILMLSITNLLACFFKFIEAHTGEKVMRLDEMFLIVIGIDPEISGLFWYSLSNFLGTGLPVFGAIYFTMEYFSAYVELKKLSEQKRIGCSKATVGYFRNSLLAIAVGL